MHEYLDKLYAYRNFLINSTLLTLANLVDARAFE